MLAPSFFMSVRSIGESKVIWQQGKSTDESGFTLIELLVATAMMVIVVGAAVLMLTSVMHREPKVSSGADRIGNARNAFEKMTADLRQGVELTAAGSAELTVKTLCGQAEGTGECEVSYVCMEEAGEGTYECVREIPGESSAAVITGLASPEVFCFYPNDESAECGEVGIGDEPTYVGIRLQYPQENNETTNSVLEAGVTLHNAPSLLGGSGGEQEVYVE
ncbi:MAG: type II secretion system protein [Solirubrobacterales bacterium]